MTSQILSVNGRLNIWVRLLQNAGPGTRNAPRFANPLRLGMRDVTADQKT
jgi:hypothetical protein